MAYNSNLFLIILIAAAVSFSVTNSSDSPPSSATSICNDTPFPTFCKSALPTTNRSANVYDYGRFSVRKSLSSARKFLALIEKYLIRPNTLTIGALRSLQDCKVLAELNIDFLSSTFLTVNTTQSVLPTLRGDDVLTLLSAILTNTQTCLDGLQATASSWSVKNGILSPLSSDARLYSVSLALFKRGWVSKKKRAASRVPHVTKKHLGFKKGQLPLTMSDRNKAIFETVGRRKLLQTDDGDNQVEVNDIVVVSQDGSGNFTTINDAVSFAPNNSKIDDGYFLIYVTAGVYQEYVTIAKNKRYLMMIGDGINQTVVTGDRNVVDGWSTFNSSTFAVVGPGFVAINMTFRNTAGASKHQAVALLNRADLSTFYSCSFEGYQDTLYTHSLRQFYRECDVYGTVDFIFGNAAALFQNCNLYPRKPDPNQFNAVTAQGRTDPNQNTGTTIHNCRIVPAEDLASNIGTTRTYLGRPWKEYSRTIIMQSYIDGFIEPSGWSVWSGEFALNTSYYAEFNNSGFGSDTSKRVTWPGFQVISSSDAANFTVSSFILGDDWIPQTGVSYTSGLLNWELTVVWTGSKIEVPVKFIVRDLDLTYHFPGIKDYINSGGFKKFVPQLEEVVVMEGVGHFINQEKPDEVNNHIYDFIQKY